MSGCALCDIGLEPFDGVHKGKGKSVPCGKIPSDLAIVAAKTEISPEAALADQRIKRWEDALLREMSGLGRIPLTPIDLTAIIKRVRNKLNAE